MAGYGEGSAIGSDRGKGWQVRARAETASETADERVATDTEELQLPSAGVRGTIMVELWLYLAAISLGLLHGIQSLLDRDR